MPEIKTLYISFRNNSLNTLTIIVYDYAENVIDTISLASNSSYDLDEPYYINYYYFSVETEQGYAEKIDFRQADIEGWARPEQPTGYPRVPFTLSSLGTNVTTIYIEDILSTGQDKMFYQIGGEFEIKFATYTGTGIYYYLYADSGITPVYLGNEPTRSNVDEGVKRTFYSFSGWTPEISEVSEDTTYTATFTSIDRYLVVFQNFNEVALQRSYYSLGATPSYTGSTPTKPTTNQFEYTFSGWTPDINVVTEEGAIYTAQYEESTLPFTLTLYQNSSESNRLDKTNYLTSVDELEGTLRTESSIVNPTITIERQYIDFNYIFINHFNRYYFLKDAISISKNLWELHLSVDVLMSFKDTILTQECLIDRQENNYDSALRDEELVYYNYKEYEIIERALPLFAKGSHDYCYTLISTGRDKSK